MGSSRDGIEGGKSGCGPVGSWASLEAERYRDQSTDGEGVVGSCERGDGDG